MLHNKKETGFKTFKVYKKIKNVGGRKSN